MPELSRYLKKIVRNDLIKKVKKKRVKMRLGKHVASPFVLVTFFSHTVILSKHHLFYNIIRIIRSIDIMANLISNNIRFINTIVWSRCLD